MGIEVQGGAMSGIIPRNTGIPITKKQPFTTASDDQEVVGVRIFEGERPLTKHNHFLGEFDLTGIPRAPRGVPEIDVTFDIDVDGILKVSVQLRSYVYFFDFCFKVTAQEKTGGNKKSIMINAKTNRLSDEQINRMIKVAELFSDEDKLVKQRIDAKNELESYVLSPHILRNN